MILLVAFQLLDALTTWVGITRLGGQEMHPYLAWLISMNRWDLVILGKLVWCGLFYLALWWFRFPNKQRLFSIRLASILSAAACVWNGYGILTVIL